MAFQEKHTTGQKSKSTTRAAEQTATTPTTSTQPAEREIVTVNTVAFVHGENAHSEGQGLQDDFEQFCRNRDISREEATARLGLCKEPVQETEQPKVNTEVPTTAVEIRVFEALCDLGKNVCNMIAAPAATA